MNMINNIGAIYGVTGDCSYYSKQASYGDYANRSAGTLKRYYNIHTTLFTDRVVQYDNFDSVVELPDLPSNGPFFGKIKCMQLSPYSKTLFLDADTLVLSSRVQLIFDMLDKFDIVGVHAPAGVPINRPDKYAHIPISFPEINTGVVGFRLNNITEQLFNVWYDCYKYERSNSNDPSIAAGNDQASFRYAIWESDIRLGILPEEYNYRKNDTISFPENEQRGIRNTVIHHNRPNNPEIL